MSLLFLKTIKTVEEEVGDYVENGYMLFNLQITKFLFHELRGVRRQQAVKTHELMSVINQNLPLSYLH